MRKLMLLLAVGSLWLFLAALPVFADGGPHTSATNSGVSTLTADSCAGCHRAHTANGEYLLNKATEEDLCLGCHGAASTGATTDVMTGVQYAITAGGLRDKVATTIGALRNGGFDQARIGDVGRFADGTSRRPKVVVDDTLGADNDVTSSHIAMAAVNGLTNPGVAWGSGDTGLGAGPTVSLSCASCHNPHGNGQYRILNPTPDSAITGFQTYDIKSIDGNLDLVTTKAGHEFQVGAVVRFSTAVGGLAAATTYTIVNVPTGVSFQVGTFTSTGFTPTDLSASGATGSVSRYQAVVTDSPAGTVTAGVPQLKNYTVMQVKGTQGTDSTYMLYAQNVLDARAAGSFNGTVGAFSPTDGDYFHRQVPWKGTGADDAPNGQPATNPSTAVGDVAFNVQMTAWCTSCHTRYYANQNAPSAGHTEGSSAPVQRAIWKSNTPAGGFTTASTNQLDATTDPGVTKASNHGFAIGDTITMHNVTGVTDGNYIVATVPSGSTFTLVDPTTYAPVTGTTATYVIPIVPPGTTPSFATYAIRFSDVQAAQSWWFPRTNNAGAVDSTYKFQHRTDGNKACTTCHVAHGSNRDMTGTFSSVYTQPDGIASASSRLLKIDNRGTCQACHEPTGTWSTLNPSGTWQGPAGGNVLP